VSPKDIHDDRCQAGGLVVARGAFGGLMLIENGAGNGQALTYFLNASRMITDDLIGDSYDVAQSLRLKMANAFFKMSRSRSTRLSSASSSLTRESREEATGPLSRSS